MTASVQLAILEQSLSQPEPFWLRASEAIDWIQAPSIAHDAKRDEWFPDGTLNTCYNCLDRHVQHGRGERDCFHHVSPFLNQGTSASLVAPQSSYTYRQVLDHVQTLAGVLYHTLGIRKGDRVIIYMSMVPETAFAMLACARLGAIHSTVFGGFSAKELAKRVDDAEPKAIIATTCGIEPRGVIEYQPIIGEAIQESKKRPDSLLVLRRTGIKNHAPQPVKLDGLLKTYDYREEMDETAAAGQQFKECAVMKSSDPLYILYTSGTTAAPKGVVRTHGGHAVSSLYCLQHSFGQDKDAVVFCASDFGWVVGHSFILYAPLLLGCTSIVFEGKPVLPDASVWWQIVERYKVTGLFTAPTALRAVRREDPEARHLKAHNLKSLQTLYLAGERSEPEIVRLYEHLLKEHAGPHVRVNDNYWSTESGSPITARFLGSREFAPAGSKPGSAGLPLPGMSLTIVDDRGKPLSAGQMGNLVIRKPLAPSFARTLWRDPDRYHSAYMKRFPGYFDTGDAAVIDEEGYVHVLSRTDDVINVAGHRLGTSLLESVISRHPLVSECCVVGAQDEIKGQVPFAVVTRSGIEAAKHIDVASLLKELNQTIRKDVGPIAALGGLVVGKLPKTRSGKTLRRSIRSAVAAGAKGDFDHKPSYPPTIEDVGALSEATEAIYSHFKKQKRLGSKL